MVSIPSITQTTLSGLEAISPLSLPEVSTGTDSIRVTQVTSTSSVVQLSGTGQVLSADSLLNDSLQSLQTSPSAATPESVVDATETFVAAFNQTQTSINEALPLLESQPDSTLINQLSQTLNAAAATAPATGAETGSLTELEAIGITAQTSVVPGTEQTTVTLSIDQTTLTAAASANPASTQALLAEATEPLLQQVASFETVATSNIGFGNNAVAQNAGIQTALLTNQPADSLANSVQVNDLALDASPLNPNAIDSASTLLNGTLSATLDAAADASATTSAETSAQDEAPNTATRVNANDTDLTITTQSDTAPAIVSATATPVTQTITPTPATGVTTTTAAPTASAETSAGNTPVQVSPLATEAQRIINNNAFNPFYSAVIANYHLADGAAKPADQPLSEPVTPAPVVEIQRIQAINGETR